MHYLSIVGPSREIILSNPSATGQIGAFCFVEEYTPSVGDYTNPAQPIVDDLAVVLEAISDDELRQLIRGLADLLARARLYQLDGIGDPVYLRARVADEPSNWDAEILGGSLELERDTLRTMGQLKVRARLTIERGPFVGPEQEISLSSSTQGARTGGVEIYNDYRNWAQMAANQVTGSMPAPLRFRVTNGTGGSISWRHFYVGGNTFATPASFAHYLLGASSLNGATVSWTAGSNHLTKRYAWDLTSTQLAAARGQYFRILAAFGGITPRCYVQAHAGASIGNVLIPSQSMPEVWSGDPIGNELLDLGSLQLPARRDAATAELAVMLSVRQTSGTGGTTVSSVQLMPGHNTRHYEQIGYSTVAAGYIEVDGYERRMYGGAGGQRYDIVRGDEEPVLVWPGEVQRIYVLFDEASGDYVPGRKSTLRAWYKPHRETI